MSMLSRLSFILFFSCFLVSSARVFSISVPAPVLPNADANISSTEIDPNAINVPAPRLSNTPEQDSEENGEENTPGGEEKQVTVEDDLNLDKDKKHVHRYVDQLLGFGDTDEIAPESLTEASVATQIKNLQKNIKALQISLEGYERSKRSSRSRANILYSKIRSAFREYFGGDFPDSTENISIPRRQRSVRTKASKSSASFNKNKKYTVKAGYAGGYPTKNYGSASSKQIVYPTKFYGNGSQYTVKTLGATQSAPSKAIAPLANYPTKTYGITQNNGGKSSLLPTGKYTVKNLNDRPYFNKKCCGN